MATTTTGLDLFDRQLYVDGFPHELFAAIRADGPVQRLPWLRPSQPYADVVEQPDELWHVFGQPEIRQVNRDWEGFSARGGPTVPRGPEGSVGMLSLDPPEHHRLRHVVSSAFTPRMVARLQQLIDDRVVSLLDAVDRDRFDFVSGVADPLPMHVIADIIGIPEADRAWVFERVRLAARALDPDFGPTGGGLELYAYAQDLAAAKRREPTDDVWSTIVASALPPDDVNMFFMILALAGSETTRNALAQGFVALVDHPAEWAALRDDPTLVERTGADEILRYTSPVLTFGRDATRDTVVAGELVRHGERVVMWHVVGNRDPRVFRDPDRLDLSRTPNPHVAFGGGGPHYCLGANLATKEIQSVFAHLAGVAKELEITEPPVWDGPGPISNVGCSIARLPVSLRS